MTKQEFKICEAVALGLSHYYMGPKDKRKVTEEDRRLAEKLIPTLPKGFTMMSESYEFSIWRKKIIFFRLPIDNTLTIMYI